MGSLYVGKEDLEYMRESHKPRKCDEYPTENGLLKELLHHLETELKVLSENPDLVNSDTITTIYYNHLECKKMLLKGYYDAGILTPTK